MRAHKTVTAAFLGMLLVFLSSCGALSSKESAALSKSSDAEAMENYISVGFSQVGSESMWRRANTQSVQEALSTDNGYFLLYNNARQKQENQIKDLRSYISQLVDYIVFSPVTEEGWETVLTEAKDAGIPVILLDRTINASDADLYTTLVGEDMQGEGTKAGLWLEQDLIESGEEDEDMEIVVLKGTTGSSAQIGRSIGFDSIAARHQNWTIEAQVDGDFTRAKGKEVMARLLNEFPDMDVLVSQNDDMTMGALEAMDEAGFDPTSLRIISFDATREALEKVEEGIIDVDVECNPLSGELLSEVIQRMENGESIEKTYYTDEMVFTKDNVSEYLPDRQY